MSIFSKIIGGSIVTAVEGVANVVDQFVETPDEKREWEIIKAKMAQQPQLAQIEINKVEASHRTLFVAGWRPAIGWICATGLGYMYIINPTIQWFTGTVGPEMPTDIMFELILGMLGLSGLRTYEKIAGKAK